MHNDKIKAGSSQLPMHL